MLFNWNKEVFSLPRKSVNRVFSVKNLYATSNDVLKISSEDGKLFPVIDPLPMISINQSKISKKSKIIVLNDRGNDFGILVDEIVGLESINEDDLETPSVNDKRFVLNIVNGIKLIDPRTFLTPDVKHLFKSINTIDEESLVENNKIFGGNWSDKDSIKTDLKTKILNLLLETEKNLDSKYANSVKDIHNLADKL